MMAIDHAQLFTLENAIVLLWALCLATIPLPYLPLNSQLLIAQLILSFILFLRRKPKQLKYKKFLLVYLTPFVMSLLSFVFISNSSYKVMEKETAAIIFPFVTFFLVNADFSFSEKQYCIVLLFFLVSVVSILLFTYIRSLFIPEEFFAHNFLTFDICHPTYFSFYCGTAILILIQLRKYYSCKAKWLAFLSVIMILIYMTLLSSRMPLAATMIILITIMIASGSNIKTKILYILGLAGLLTVIVVIILNSPRLEYRFFLALEKNFEIRKVVWDSSIEVFKDHPLFGVGAGDDQVYLDEYYMRHTEQPEAYLEFNSHNYLLYVLVTFGLVGLAIVIFFWFRIFRLAFRLRNNLLINAVALFLMCSMTEVLLARQQGIAFFYIFYSLNLLYEIGKKDNSNALADEKECDKE